MSGYFDVPTDYDGYLIGYFEQDTFLNSHVFFLMSNK